jgi:hypothetical protein
MKYKKGEKYIISAVHKEDAFQEDGLVGKVAIVMKDLNISTKGKPWLSGMLYVKDFSLNPVTYFYAIKLKKIKEVNNGSK